MNKSKNCSRCAAKRVSAVLLAMLIGMPSFVYADTGFTQPLEAAPAEESVANEVQEIEPDAAEKEEAEPNDESQSQQEQEPEQQPLISIENATLTGLTDMVYTGKPLQQSSLKLLYKGEVVPAGDYTVTYHNNTRPGIATITVTGKNAYTGTKTCTFKIRDTASKTVKLATGRKLVFKDEIQKHNLLSKKERPYALRLEALSNKHILLKWPDCKAEGGNLTGYIVLRKKGSEKNYKEIAKVSAGKCRYEDRNVKKNEKYYYVVVGYLKERGSALMRSEISHTAVGVRSDSTRKNPYAPNRSGLSPTVKRNYKTITVGVGQTRKLSLKYPGMAFSTWTRWKSLDSSIATVNENGVVKGKMLGTAEITATLPNGYEMIYKIKVCHPTVVSGLKLKKNLVSGDKYSDTIYVTNPQGRKAYLEMYRNGKWVTKKTFRLKGGEKKAKIRIKWTKDWWSKEKSKWRIRIPARRGAASYFSPTIVLKAKRKYQNPKNMVQIRQKISKHGLSYYTSPVKIKRWSTRSQCVEAMVDRAYDYLGDPYVVCQSRQPGRGVDCSGIVMQACYAAGVDLWPSNPYRHRFWKYEYESRYLFKNKKLQKVSWKNRKRGDLIFYSKYGTIIHVAIYLGNNKIIHSWPGGIRVSNVYGWGDIAGVRRVFHK